MTVIILLLLSTIIAAVLPVPSHASAETADRLNRAITEIQANVVFIRHATAPGFGDPPDFVIDDCASQRNLDENGRQQAAAIGRSIQAAGIQFSGIFSSQWCRCKETAVYLALGDWQEFAGLNSFFQGLVDRDETMQLLEEKFARLKPAPDDLLLLVTHQVVINAVTGISPPSGGLVVYNTQTGARQAVWLE
ncbi:MAG: histidine phosphatase family protein [Gammaproteobacteria bacterium]